MDYVPLENSVQVNIDYRAVVEQKINRLDLNTCPSPALGFNWVDVGKFSTAKRSFLYIFIQIKSISGFGELKP
jgi:hypothetical protein